MHIDMTGKQELQYSDKIDFKTKDMTGKQELQYSDKIDFKTKDIKKDKEGHYLMIKGSIQGEDVTIVNIYAPNTGTHRYTKQILTDIKGEIDGNTIIVGDFNPCSYQWTDPLDRKPIKQQRS